jgi:hypothetical protein
LGKGQHTVDWHIQKPGARAIRAIAATRERRHGDDQERDGGPCSDGAAADQSQKVTARRHSTPPDRHKNDAGVE